jgi:hypothetical protein
MAESHTCMIGLKTLLDAEIDRRLEDPEMAENRASLIELRTMLDAKIDAFSRQMSSERGGLRP